MARPKKPRCLRFRPNIYYFKPRGVPMRMLEEVVLQPDELEVLKLYEIDQLDQKGAANEMKISQPSFARTLDKAHKKIAEAIVSGKAILIETKE